MKRKLLATILVFVCYELHAQYVFLIPSHFHGIFSDQLSSARAQGMGYTTITLDGISNSIYNPATISPGNTTIDLGLNYAKGHPTLPKSYYPFAGISFRPLKKLAVGASMFAWIDPDSYWTATIAGTDIDTDKKTQHLYSLSAAYAICDDLHFGLSGNYITEQAVRGITTASEFFMSAGLIYDRKLEIFRTKKITNQSVRVAASLVNTLMNSRAEQTYEDLLNYRDIPIVLRGGLAYKFSIPVSASFARGKKFFAESPEILDLSVRFQYQDWLKRKEHIYEDHRYSNAIGFGAEAWFMNAVALRLGYYRETRPDEVDPGDILATEDRKRGFTWGLGANVPIQRMTGGNIPLDVEVNIVTQRMMNQILDTYPNNEFQDRKFQFCMGLNIKWHR